RFANEAALKYFLLGAFSSALLVYGFAWLFGITGSTRFDEIAKSLQATGIANGPTIIALALITVGLGFKAAVVPFHQWTPDAYEGAPTPATAFMSVAPKAAAFAAILRVLVSGMGPLAVDWSSVFAVLAAVTMTAGNIVALVQMNTKRMLAYSSIAHTGYILAAVAATAAGPSAGAAVLFYVFAYGVMNLGAFACLLYIDLEGTRGATLDELNGFARREPFGALAFAIFLISLTGIPPTIGFVAKFLVIQPVLDAGYAWLAVLRFVRQRCGDERAIAFDQLRPIALRPTGERVDPILEIRGVVRTHLARRLLQQEREAPLLKGRIARRVLGDEPRRVFRRVADARA